MFGISFDSFFIIQTGKPKAQFSGRLDRAAEVSLHFSLSSIKCSSSYMVYYMQQTVLF